MTFTAADPGASCFSSISRTTYRSFDRGGSHFIVLDTEMPGQASRIAGEQLEWLKNDLASADGAWHIFVALHRPSLAGGESYGRFA